MLIDIAEVKALPDFKLWLKFADGATEEVDLKARLTFSGVFEKLKSPEEFAKVRVDPEIGTICWPNGADLDPDVLYALVTGQPIETAH